MYRQGQVSIAPNSHVLSGTGTFFQSVANAQIGSLLTFDNTRFYVIRAVTSDDAIEIEDILTGGPYTGAPLSAANYSLIPPMGAGFSGAVAVRTMQTQQVQQARDRGLLDFFFSDDAEIDLTLYTGQTTRFKTVKEIDRIASVAAGASTDVSGLEGRISAIESEVTLIEPKFVDFNAKYPTFTQRYTDIDTWYQDFAQHYPTFTQRYNAMLHTLHPQALSARDDAISAKEAAQSAQQAVNTQHGEVATWRSDIDAWHTVFARDYPLFDSAYQDFVTTQLPAAQSAAAQTSADKLATQAARDEAVQAVSSVTGAMFFAGPWDARPGTVPPTPPDGSALYLISHAGTVQGTAYRAGDSMAYNTVTQTWYRVGGGAHYDTIAGQFNESYILTRDINTNNGTELILNAGEARGKFTGQTSELVYVNAESGLSINTPDRAHPNFQTGYSRDETIIRGNEILIKGNEVYHEGNLPDFSDAASLQGKQLVAGATWDLIRNRIAHIGNDGGMEVGRFIDFHTNGSTADFDVRLDATANALNVAGVANDGLKVNGNEVMHTGNLFDRSNVWRGFQNFQHPSGIRLESNYPVIQMKETDTGAQFDIRVDFSTWTVRNAGNQSLLQVKDDSTRVTQGTFFAPSIRAVSTLYLETYNRIGEAGFVAGGSTSDGGRFWIAPRVHGDTAPRYGEEFGYKANLGWQFESSLHILGNAQGTIAGADWNAGWLKIGSEGLGWSIDSNEIYNGGEAIIGTLSGALAFRVKGDTLFHHNNNNEIARIVSEGLKLPDNLSLRLGNSSDFRLAHDGSNTRLNNFTGDVYISNYAAGREINLETETTQGTRYRGIAVAGESGAVNTYLYGGTGQLRAKTWADSFQIFGKLELQPVDSNLEGGEVRFKPAPNDPNTNDWWIDRYSDVMRLIRGGSGVAMEVREGYTRIYGSDAAPLRVRSLDPDTSYMNFIRNNATRIAAVGGDSQGGFIHSVERNAMLRVRSGEIHYSNGNGFLIIGPQNTSFSHFITDRPTFYFNRKINAESEIKIHNQDVRLASTNSRVQNTGTAQIRGASTSQFALEVKAATGSDSVIRFHNPGDYAVNFGLSAIRNRLTTGGYSDGTGSERDLVTRAPLYLTNLSTNRDIRSRHHGNHAVVQLWRHVDGARLTVINDGWLQGDTITIYVTDPRGTLEIVNPNNNTYMPDGTVVTANTVMTIDQACTITLYFYSSTGLMLHIH